MTYQQPNMIMSGSSAANAAMPGIEQVGTVGTRRYYKTAHLEGVLLCDITAVDQAKHVGGLFLTNGEQFWFAAGAILEDALNKGIIGSITGINLSAIAEQKDGTPTTQSSDVEILIDGQLKVHPYSIISSVNTRVHMAETIDVWFPGDVRAYGLVASCTNGAGIGYLDPTWKAWARNFFAGGDATVDAPYFTDAFNKQMYTWSFLQTEIVGRKTFDEIWEINKQAIVHPAEAPDEFVNEANAQWPTVKALRTERIDKPVVYVNTIWRSGRIFNGYQPAAKFSGALACSAFNFTKSTTVQNGIPAGAIMTRGLPNTTDPLWMQPKPMITCTNVPFSSMGAGLPQLVSYFDNNSVDSLDFGRGTIEGMSFRNWQLGHVLYDKVVLKVEPAAFLPTTYTSIFKYAVDGVDMSSIFTGTTDTGTGSTVDFSSASSQETNLRARYAEQALKPSLVKYVASRGNLATGTREFARALEDKVVAEL